MDELRFRTQQSPRNESTMNSLASPPRNGTRLPQPVSSHDPRTSLPRRFTTDSGRVPTLSTLNTQRVPEQAQDYTTQTLHKVQLIEKKKQEYERLREQKRRFEVEMQRIDLAQRQGELELQQMESDLAGTMTGHQSEPTTPPEYLETSTGFPTMLSRPNRYSTSSLTSPPGLLNRVGRSGSQLASPQSGMLQNRFAFDDQLPSRSVPGSRRNSDEDEKEEAVRQDPTSHRSTNALNRYSMPVTRSRSGLYDSLDGTGTTRFLFGDDEAGDIKYNQGTAPDEAFPTLLRRDDQISLSTIGSAQLNGSTAPTVAFRHSLDLKYFAEPPSDPANSTIAPSGNHIMSTPPKLTNSYSTGDVPTVKGGSGAGGLASNTNNHAQQHFHNHNASLGRIPAGAMANRHSRELSSDANSSPGRDQPGAFQSIHSALQGSAAPFGPTANAPAVNQGSGVGPPGHLSQLQSQFPYYTGGNFAPANSGPTSAALYAGVPVVALQNMNLGTYNPQSYTGGYNTYSPQQSRDSQARVIQHRRQQDNEGMAKYNGMPIDKFVGGIFDLCKDQHGCRFLQKKLEERDPETVHKIWLETNRRVVELMTDPFGNYLCQKLLEYCNDDERSVLVTNAAPNMVQVALNQHGTRALQKMIEFISTPGQVSTIIDALRYRVVELIQDLNGNHVIQKCLNKLSSQDAQFIFDAVGNNCVEVGTHRHGCCVLQRCIDHADGDQKSWLIERITEHAHTLVQDPYGNYVVQYIIDLNETSFTEPVVRQFQGRVTQLSRHKFSSNVIEKCLRCSSDQSKDIIVDELLIPGEMEKLIRDGFANYVIQTALDYATPYKRTTLIDAIRPLLPAVRATPYGRRIQAKIHTYDGRNSGQATPADPTGGQIPLAQHSRGLSNGSIGLPQSRSYGSIHSSISSPGGIAPPRGNHQNYSPGNMLPVGAPAQRLPQAAAFGYTQPRGNGALPADNGEAQWL